MDDDRQALTDKLVDLTYSWVDVEREVQRLEKGSEPRLTEALRRAFRVEARYHENWAGDEGTTYWLLFDVRDPRARLASRTIEEDERGLLGSVIQRVARHWDGRYPFFVARVAPTRPVEGEVCHRQLEPHLPPSGLEDVPIPRPTSAVPLVEREGTTSRPSRSRSTTRSARPG
jgi:hypothetical protein